MSELIAEARVLVTPDTTKFRALLEAEVASATKGIVVPIAVTPVAAGGVSAAAANQQLVAGAAAAAASEQRLASEIAGATAAERSAAAATAAHVRQLGQLERGAGATGLSFLGLRGATLAASGAFITGAAATLAFSKAISEAVGFETQLNTFQVVAGATAEQMKRVSETAKELGQDVSLPGVSAADAAQAFTELSKAGLSVQDSLDGARGVLQLATAAGIDNASATELAASALNAFGLQGDQAVHVADVLANSANDAQGSITDIGIALQQASAAGRQAGLSLEQTTAILTEFARNGIKGSDAGTLLRTLLIRLINPTDKAAEVIKQLGLNVRDASGAIDVGVFQQFADATRTLTPAARDQAAAIIAGQDAFRGLSILAREGGAALEAQVGSLNKAGTAAAVAGAKMKGLAGDASALQSNLETLGITIGTVLVPALGSLARGANLIVTGFQKAGDAFQSFVGDTEFDAANANLDELTGHLADLQGQADDFRRSNSQGFLPPSLTADQAALVKQIRDIGKSLTDTPAGFQKFVRIVSAESPQVKTAMEDNVITPLERTQLESTALGKAFVAALPKTAFSGLGAAVKSGLEDAGAAAKAGVADLGAEIHSGIEDAGRQAVIDARNLGTDVGDALKSSLQAATAGIAQGTGQQAGLEDVFNQLLLGGASPQQQVAELQRQFSVQQGIIDKATAGLKGLTAGDKGFATLTKAVRDAREKQVQINSQIDAIQSQAAADQQARVSKAKQQATAAQSAQQKADQAVLDSFAPAQNRIDLAAISANATARLSDNVKLQTLIIAEANREVRIITSTVNDVKTRNTALAAQAETIKAAEVERNRLIAQIAATATENRRKAADALTASLGKAITLAGLRENDKAEVTAINKAIANARNRIKNYKKLGLNLQDEKIALEQLINQRDDVLDTAKSATEGLAGGTTLVDLFKENQQIAAQAGNIGRLPSQLTSSAANQPIRDLVQQRLDLRVSDPTRDNLARTQQTTTERLITSLEQLTSALTGNSTTVGGFRVKGGVIDPTGTGIKDLAKEQRFFYQKQAKQMVEHGLVA